MFFSLKKSTLTILSQLAMLALLSVSQLSAAVTLSPIKFDKDSITSSVEGILASKQIDAWYQFDANEGQYAVINIKGIKDAKEVANVGVLTTPSGEKSGDKGRIVYQGCLPETGTYKLKIARNLMATRGGLAGYHAEIVLLPAEKSKDLCK